MKKLKGNEIINMYLNFFGERGHTIIESASLIPKDDPTVLWINAGVTPLKKYFDGTIESGSYVARAEETGDTYFSLGTMWDEIEEMYGLTDKEMFDLFNTKALDDAVLSDKVIRFGQDPREWSETALGDEWNYLKSRYNYTGLLENGGYWYAIK